MRGTLAIATLLVGSALFVQASTPADPLMAEIERWSALLRDDRSPDDFAKQVREGAGAGMARIEQALKDDRRLLALLRMSSVANDVAALRYLKERPAAERAEVGAFEKEWQRLGGVLAPSQGPISPLAFADIRPAVVRAIGEAALPQVGVYYDASVEYGRNTTPDSGLYYLGAAQGQRDFGGRCLRTLSPPPRRRCAAAARLAGELDALQDELLAAYRPPASVDRHREFIVASSALKEARELRRGRLAARRAAALPAGGACASRRCARRRRRAGCALPDKLKALEARACARRRRPQPGPRPSSSAAQADLGRARDRRPRGDRGRRRARSAAALLRRARARAAAAARGRAARHRHARPLALHLKPLRSSRSAGAERGAVVRRRGAVRGGELRRVGAGQAVRRDALPGDLRGRRAGGEAQGLRLLRQGRRRWETAATRRSRARPATTASAPT